MLPSSTHRPADNALGVTLVHHIAPFSGRTQLPLPSHSRHRSVGSSGSSGGMTSPKVSEQAGAAAADALSSHAPTSHPPHTTNGLSDGGNGNGRAGSSGGGALVSGPFGAALPGIVAAFRRRVDAEFKGLYTWFEDESLHVTVRALMG